MTSPGRLALLLIWTGLFLAAAAPAARAQQDAPKAPPPGPGVGEVQLDAEQFGVGGLVRPGDWCGVRVRVLDASPKQREVVIQLSVPDADGDRVLVQREITTNPGVPQGTWLYLRVPARFGQGDTLTVSAYEGVETAGAGLKPGRRLGSSPLIAPGVIEPTSGLLAIIGPKTFGLNRYEARAGVSGSYPPFGHEITRVSYALTPDKLPDRWIGYAPFETVVWGQGNPGELRAERATALKEWVRRGGHLVVVLPAVGETWTNPQASELYELMPAVRVNRREGVNLSDYRTLITFDRSAPLPDSSVVYSFTRSDNALPSDAMLIFTGTKGDCVVARRLYGSGMVTLVGLDLNNRLLSDNEALEPVVFWNRVLGRRGILPTERQLKGEVLKNEIPSRAGDVDFDTEIVSLISKQGSAAAGVFYGLLVFAAYWLVAGPVGFMLLRRKGWIRHSWLGFVAAGAAFTGLAWGGATLLRERRVSADHVTLVDHVFGQPVDRARAWLSVLVPWYGQATIAIADGAERAESANLLTAWDPPSATAQVGSFPDARGYVVDARAPSAITVPVRSTVKQVQADWAGGTIWKMPFPVADSGGNPTRLSANERPGVGDSFATGSLSHDLPVALRDVYVIVVPRQEPLNRSRLDWSAMNARARIFTTVDGAEWRPGEVLDLAEFTKVRSSNDQNLASDWLRRLRDKWGVTDDFQQAISTGKKIRPADAIERLAGVAFFSQLEPPAVGDTGLKGSPVARRRLTHTWDLGRWFSQPCIIIVGRLGDEKQRCPCPIPMSVNGEKLPAAGTTVLRWIYPLPDNPPDPSPRNAPGTDGPADPGPA